MLTSLTYYLSYHLFPFLHTKKGGSSMLGLIGLCFTIYLLAYFTIKLEGSPIEVKTIRSFEDYFIDYSRNRLGDGKNE